MLAVNVLKKFGIVGGGVVGVLVALVALVAIWVGLALVAGLIPGFLLMIVMGIIHSFAPAVPALSFVASWLIFVVIAALCGV